MQRFILHTMIIAAVSASLGLSACAIQTAQSTDPTQVEPAAGSRDILPQTTDQARGATY